MLFIEIVFNSSKKRQSIKTFSRNIIRINTKSRCIHNVPADQESEVVIGFVFFLSLVTLAVAFARVFKPRERE